MIYAMIKNGVIDNVIVADYTSAQLLKNNLGYDEAINVDNYPVQKGDIYENGSFLTGEDKLDSEGNLLIPKGTVIQRKMSDEEYIKILEDRLKMAQIALDDLILNGGV